MYFVLLYINRKAIRDEGKEEEGRGKEIPEHELKWYKDLSCVAFLYDDYHPNRWYWEVVATVEKLIMTVILSVIATDPGVQVQ